MALPHQNTICFQHKFHTGRVKVSPGLDRLWNYLYALLWTWNGKYAGTGFLLPLRKWDRLKELKYMQKSPKSQLKLTRAEILHHDDKNEVLFRMLEC